MQPTPTLQRALRRLPLTTKQGPREYYKGTRTGSMGRHTPHGRYIIDFKKVRTYVVPDPQLIGDFRLTPFVSRKITIQRGDFSGWKGGPTSGARYLKMWKEENGET